jgi:hypothetical protein
VVVFAFVISTQAVEHGQVAALAEAADQAARIAAGFPLPQRSLPVVRSQLCFFSSLSVVLARLLLRRASAVRAFALV